jgi:hypothetical protein
MKRHVQDVMVLVTCNIMILMIVISVLEMAGFMKEWNKFISDTKII